MVIITWHSLNRFSNRFYLLKGTSIEDNGTKAAAIDFMTSKQMSIKRKESNTSSISKVRSRMLYVILL